MPQHLYKLPYHKCIIMLIERKTSNVVLKSLDVGENKTQIFITIQLKLMGV